MNPKEACPNVNEWSLLIENQVDPATRQRLELHRAACPKCDGEAALLESFLRAEAKPDELNDVAWITSQVANAGRERRAPSQSRQPWWQSLLPDSSWHRWATAAAVMVFVAVGLQWQPRRPEVPHSIESSQMRGSTLRIETPLGDVSVAPTSIRWNKVDGAVRYQMQISAVDGEVLWRSSLTDQVSLDQIPTGLFAPRKSLRIRVSAFGVNGDTLIDSGDVAVRFVQPGGSK
jgi:hypothetical protein